MTVFDYLVLLIVATSLLLGMWRGVVGEIIALVAWVLAFFAAKWWGTPLAHWFTAISDPTLRIVAGWVAVFMATLVIMALLRLTVRSLIKALGMTLSDRLLGLLFGVARGLAIVLLLVAVGGMTALPKEKWWSEAYFAAPLETAVLASKPWLPSDVAKRIRFG
ncbi:MAG: CvpA family protein [Candidatus Accumulibacter phosphatis]|jgi:membrane protein required for colicin V production|uniref:Pur regulon 18 kDa protein n=1 Tax=Candidatus Accumulibacter phosphatis TaxID=327160 RepID=A0A080LUB7_9PROT|nr:CvpA family protein [Accumulibacter sp.]KFB71250.1 MAG: Pur regulon 18 kDa protein [Candidatus Accumulibacter phosphatis]MBL8409611.1 CvpA family protein [Accumulibacter sp.]HRF10600.1 CvpA family protein [Candidatus Accumulibacter phosphatis]